MPEVNLGESRASVSRGIGHLLLVACGCMLALIPIAHGVAATAAGVSDRGDMNPAWSPDGLQIAFDSSIRGDSDIYLVSAAGGKSRQLTQNAANDVEPAWSPDGRKIAFSSDRTDAYEIYVMNRDGTGQRRLTHDRDWNSNPAWSPDGRTIVFRRAQGGIAAIDADGSNERRLTRGARAALDDDPAWSPDSRSIVFARGRSNFTTALYVMDSDGTNLRRLMGTDAVLGNPVGDPTWSPDGRSIAFGAFRQTLTPAPLGPWFTELYVMNAEGGHERRLTRNIAADWAPAWSPDGRQIVFPSTGTPDGEWRLYLMNADGSKQRRLTG